MPAKKAGQNENEQNRHKEFGTGKGKMRLCAHWTCPETVLKDCTTIEVCIGKVRSQYGKILVLGPGIVGESWC